VDKRYAPLVVARKYWEKPDEFDTVPVAAKMAYADAPRTGDQVTSRPSFACPSGSVDWVTAELRVVVPPFASMAAIATENAVELASEPVVVATAGVATWAIGVPMAQFGALVLATVAVLDPFVMSARWKRNGET
jgi:hypothetical protein